MVAGASTADSARGAANAGSFLPTATNAITKPPAAKASPASIPTDARLRPGTSSPGTSGPATPIESRPRRSASLTSGGTTMSADNKATAMLIVTTMPKSRSSGNVENISTANPPKVVNAETKNARPVRSAATRVHSSGSNPLARSSAYRATSSTANSAQVATTNGPPTVVNGESVMPSTRTSTAEVPTASSTGIIVSSPRARSRYLSTMKAATSSNATKVSWARLAVMFFSRPTPTTLSPPVVAEAWAGSRPP